MKKDTIIIILLILALLLIVYLLIMPGIDSMNLARAGFSLEESRFKEAQAQSQQFSDLNKKKQDILAKLEKLTVALPKDQGLPELIINLESLATANGLMMNSVDFRAVEKKSSVMPPQMGVEDIMPKKSQDLPDLSAGSAQPLAQSYNITEVSMNLSGGYDNFKNYLKSIEENKRLMDVISLNFNLTSHDSNSSFSLKLNAYNQ